MSITVLLPENLYSAPLRALLEPLLPPGSVIRRPEDGMENLENRRLLFAVALDPSGCNLAYYGMLQALRGCDTLLRGSVAGVIVTGVLQDGPGAVAGIRPGDVIVRVAGASINSVPNLLSTVAALKPGQAATFEVQRAGQMVELNVTPGLRPMARRPVRR